MDASGFEVLYRDYSVMVRGWLYVQTSYKELAEDLASETWLKAWKAIQRGVEPEIPGAWLITIAKRLLIDHTRKLEYGRAVSLEGLIERTNNGDESYWLTDPEDYTEAAIERMDAAQVHPLFAALPERQQQVIWLRYVEGYSEYELGKAMNCKPGTAKALQYRGMVTMKERIAA